MAASAVTSTEAGVSTTGSTAMAAASAVTSAMLRPYGHRQEKGERRDGHQAAHTS